MNRFLSTALLMGSSFVYSAVAAGPPSGPGNFNTPVYSDTLKAGIPDARDLLKEILAVTGLQANFELKEARVLNVEASIVHHQRYILYNRDFIARLHLATKTKWATVALLAHEVGHHLNGHTIKKGGSKPKLELEADEFAGFVLFNMGATLKQAQEVMHYIARTEESKSHPDRQSRLNAIERGWDRAALAKRP